MPTLPPSSDITGSSITQGQAKTWFASVRTFIAGLLGAGGTQAEALSALGAPMNASVSKSGAYTAVAADRGKVIKCTGTWTLALTSASTLGDGWNIEVVNEGSGTITIDPYVSETIDGASTKAIIAGTSAIIYCDGTKFLLAAGGGGVVSVDGNTGAVTAGQISTSATSGYGYTPINTGSNLGSGIGLFSSKSGSTLRMKSIAIANSANNPAGQISIAEASNTITITSYTGAPSGACIHPYSIIETPSKPVFACDIRPGSKIITPFGVDTVFGVWESKLGDRKMVSINGKALITPGHLVPLADGRFAAFDLDEYNKCDRDKKHPIKNAEGVYVVASSDHDAVQLVEGMDVFLQGFDEPQQIETLCEYEFNQAALPVYSFVLESFQSFYCDGISVCTLDA